MQVNSVLHRCRCGRRKRRSIPFAHANRIPRSCRLSPAALGERGLQVSLIPSSGARTTTSRLLDAQARFCLTARLIRTTKPASTQRSSVRALSVGRWPSWESLWKRNDCSQRVTPCALIGLPLHDPAPLCSVERWGSVLPPVRQPVPPVLLCCRFGGVYGHPCSLSSNSDPFPRT